MCSSLDSVSDLHTLTRPHQRKHIPLRPHTMPGNTVKEVRRCGNATGGKPVVRPGCVGGGSAAGEVVDEGAVTATAILSIGGTVLFVFLTMDDCPFLSGHLTHPDAVPGREDESIDLAAEFEG